MDKYEFVRYFDGFFAFGLWKDETENIAAENFSWKIFTTSDIRIEITWSYFDAENLKHLC